MKPCKRGPAPDLLVRHSARIGHEYSSKRELDSNHRFRWPTCDGQSLYSTVRAALSRMTEHHCAYCDGFPLDQMGREEIDHFRPKSLVCFYQLVCDWENLFLICTACNSAKRDQWDEAMLRPDGPEYYFERYFLYQTHNGKIVPNPAATKDDQERAKRTIEICDLNRTGICTARRRTVKEISKYCDDDEELENLSYRYLVPLCRNS